MENASTCEHCGNPITFKPDPTGQRGMAWATDEEFMDYGFQCGISPDGLHHAACSTRIDEDEEARTMTASCECRKWNVVLRWGRNLPVPTTRSRAYALALESCAAHFPR